MMHGLVPVKYTCNGDNVNPPLTFTNVRNITKSFAILLQQRVAAGPNVTHWLVWNIPPNVTTINENNMPAGAVVGVNDFGKNGYSGPCSDGGQQQQQYQYEVIELNTTLELPPNTDFRTFYQVLGNYVIDDADLIAVY